MNDCFKIGEWLQKSFTGQVALLIFIAFVFTASACSLKQDKQKEPERVKGIPEKAFWVGGADGGNWYLVEDVNSHKNMASIKIYNDNNGSLITSRRFILVCHSGNQEFINDLNMQINGFDGERILLKSSKNS